MAIPEEPASLSLPDYRQAGQKMQPLNLKLPAQYKRQLKELAQRMNTDPTTLGRHLLIVGMKGLASA